MRLSLSGLSSWLFSTREAVLWRPSAVPSYTLNSCSVPIDLLFDIMPSPEELLVANAKEMVNELNSFPPLAPRNQSFVVNKLQGSDAPSWAERVAGHSGSNSGMALRFIKSAQEDSKIIVFPPS